MQPQPLDQILSAVLSSVAGAELLHQGFIGVDAFTPLVGEEQSVLLELVPSLSRPELAVVLRELWRAAQETIV